MTQDYRIRIGEDNIPICNTETNSWYYHESTNHLTADNALINTANFIISYNSGLLFPQLLMGHVQYHLKNQHNQNKTQFFSLQISSLSHTLICSSNVTIPNVFILQISTQPMPSCITNYLSSRKQMLPIEDPLGWLQGLGLGEIQNTEANSSLKGA